MTLFYLFISLNERTIKMYIQVKHRLWMEICVLFQTSLIQPWGPNIFVRVKVQTDKYNLYSLVSITVEYILK
jgi:hypothetical protein